ncbi:putative inactive receptor kinase [Rosellinia necatrix]|uniref:Putative inactive receptor kinase n=1 Tax=Rosellinia necatrix TaxID=77044 RepID=A0A1W2TQ02_ROSNE|nr:putative inactive receptor kinase [Rosellinia necatrix]
MRLTCPRQPALLTAFLFAVLAAAVPYPRDALRDSGFGYLMPQECSEYCGGRNELCCSADEACYTSAGTPTCTGLAHRLAERDYTTTWTETRTYTSTISSWYVPTTTAGTGENGGPCIPPEGSGQIACGPICCANWQYCAYDGQCVANPGYSTFTEVVTTGVYVTTQFSAPYRPTSGPSATNSPPTGTFASATESSTSTGPPAVSTSGSSLSGGAIAGIVVGTIAGVVLLLLLCFCCIARGLWHAVAAIFGGGKKRRGSERIEVTEERYSRHGSASAAVRPTHRRWFGVGGGGRPSTAASRKEKKSSGGGGGLGWLVAAIGAIALLLGLRRSDKRKPSSHSRPSRSEWSSSYYSDSFTATSPSSFSSDRRTRRSRQSRQSRRSRQSRGTRSSTRPSRI